VEKDFDLQRIPTEVIYDLGRDGTGGRGGKKKGRRIKGKEGA